MATNKKGSSPQDHRDKIATVDERGKRIWVYPKKVSGWFFNLRTYVSWGLLLILFGLPFIKVGGEPFILFNILERKFILFGWYFAPQDFHLFVIAMIIGILFIAVFTVAYGRLFCGWVCPQTIFMEMVFRKIEYWIEGDANSQRRLNNSHWTAEKIAKKGLKQVIFIFISVLIAHTFLAYIIGMDEVLNIVTSPIGENWKGFTAMVFFTGAFYFVFSWLREQVCVAICPYGRLQSVLLDKNSIVVHYDTVRGEPRGHMSKQQAGNNLASAITQAKPLGDCIDCALCVQVCPTGIDIRNGTQLECINCTACMDVCDEVMQKIDRPLGLIRYDSYNGIVEGRKKWFTPRVAAYSGVLILLLALEGFLLFSRTQVEVLMLRTPGMMYQEVDENTISNLYNYQIINKTRDSFPVEFRLLEPKGNVRFIGKKPEAHPADVSEGAVFVDIPKRELDGRKNKIVLEVLSNGKRIDKVKTSFMGPLK